MTGELNFGGIFISPLLPCLIVAFFARLAASRLLASLGVYRFVWNKPLFDLSLFLVLLGVAFAGFRSLTSH
jgi:hypothetical protein